MGIWTTKRVVGLVLILLVLGSCGSGEPDVPDLASDPLGTVAPIELSPQSTAGPTPDPTPVATASPQPTLTPVPTPTPERPNIVMIMMDDMRADQMQFMPQTAALFANDGVIFEDSIVSFAECCPARATAFTGQYAHNHGVLSGSLPTGGVTRFDADNTLPVWLDEVGYNTMLVGKYLNGYGQHAPADIPPGWDDWFALIDPSTVNWYDFDVYDNGNAVAYGTEDHRTETLRDRAVADIELASQADDPFFLWFAPVAPHIGYIDREAATKGTGVFGIDAFPRALLPGAGWFPPEAQAGSLDGLVWEPPETFGGPVREGKPLVLATASELSLDQAADVAEDYQRVAETLMGVDAAVAEIVDALRRTGEMDNTVLIFTSDNGFYFGEHRIVYLKYWPYEEGIRVPLMIVGPGFDAQTVSAPVANIDLAPTMAEVARAPVGLPMDGVALQEIIGSTDDWSARPLLLETGPTFGRPVYSGVRVNDLKYIQYRDGHIELYDLAADPHEQFNIHGDPGYWERENELVGLLGALRGCAGESCTWPVAADAPPVSIIDPPPPMREGTVFALNGTGSFDPDGGDVSYRWEQSSGRAISTVGSNGPTLRGLGIGSEVDDDPIVFTLDVTDDEGFSAGSSVTLYSEQTGG